MAKHIIVPLDGSERAERALPVAISIAAESGAQLVFVCAAHAAELTDPQGYLESVAFAWGVPEAEPLVIFDRPAAAAVQYAAAEHADPLICMTTRGRGAVTAAVMSSVASAVIADVACPVIVCGARQEDVSWVPGPIVAGVDGVNPPGRMLGAAGALALDLDAPLWLVQVVAAGAVTRETDGTLVESAYLERQARPLAAAGLEVAWDVLHATDPADALIDFARSHDAHLIAVASRARTGFGGLVVGSVAQHLIRDAPLPVLITHAGD